MTNNQSLISLINDWSQGCKWGICSKSNRITFTVNVIRLHFQSSLLQRWRVRLKKLSFSWSSFLDQGPGPENQRRIKFQVPLCPHLYKGVQQLFQVNYFVHTSTHKNTIVQTRKPQKVNVFVFSVGDRRVFLPVIRCLKMWHSLTCFIISCFYYSFLKWRFEYQQTVFKHLICVHS